MSDVEVEVKDHDAIDIVANDPDTIGVEIKELDEVIVDVKDTDQIDVEVQTVGKVVSIVESDLPTVTKQDNGKILQVVGGKWKATEYIPTNFADDAEVTQILETVYGDNPDDIPEDELIKESDFATNEEVENMLNRVFG